MATRNAARHALVTGGNRGIGKAICMELARSGYEIMFTYNSGKDEALKVMEELSSFGPEPLSFQVDLSSRSQIEMFSKRIMESGLGISALINNAGVYRGTGIGEISDEEWEKVLALNLSAPFYLSRDLNHLMSDGGSIVNISSVYGIRADPWAHSYQASKAALIHLTRGLAKELGPRIRVNSVAPGYVRTDMNVEGWKSESFDSWVRKRTPMARWGEPEDVAHAVRFLIDPANSFITGHTLVVDGGIGL